MSSITVNAPVKINAPRGAAVAAIWFVSLLTWLEKLSRRREESRQMAGRQGEAARVRTYAQQIMGHTRASRPTFLPRQTGMNVVEHC